MTLLWRPMRHGDPFHEIIEERGIFVAHTIRSRSNKAVNDIFEDKWKIVGKRVIAEPTPRTTFEPPRWGIYEYDVVPCVVKDNSSRIPPAPSGEAPLISFRKVVR